MSYGILVPNPGGAEQMQWSLMPELPSLLAGQVRIKHTAIGVDMIDTYQRAGHYPVSHWPLVPGLEAAGIVTAIAAGITHLQVGDRVVYLSAQPGSYCQERIVPAKNCVRLPDWLSDEQAAAALYKGLTAQHLLRSCFAVQAGQKILVLGAASGVGLVLCQWAKYLGATVLGTVSNPAHAAFVKAHGCDEAVIFTKENVPDAVLALTSGQGVDVVYDNVGQSSFYDSLDCLKKGGTMISYGQSSGPVPHFDISHLLQRGSLFFKRANLFGALANRQDLLQAMAEWLDVVARGVVKIDLQQRYALPDAGKAHAALESRTTLGSTVLLAA